MLKGKGRGARATKAYICLFVCFNTKAVHLEVAVDLRTDAFINCLKRFISRREIVAKIFSDNATNFYKANTKLEEVEALMDSDAHKERVSIYCHDHRIQWHFIPPRSP